MARYLRREKDGAVFTWTEALSKHEGMVEISAEDLPGGLRHDTAKETLAALAEVQVRLAHTLRTEGLKEPPTLGARPLWEKRRVYQIRFEEFGEGPKAEARNKLGAEFEASELYLEWVLRGHVGFVAKHGEKELTKIRGHIDAAPPVKLEVQDVQVAVNTETPGKPTYSDLTEIQLSEMNREKLYDYAKGRYGKTYPLKVSNAQVREDIWKMQNDAKAKG